MLAGVLPPVPIAAAHSAAPARCGGGRRARTRNASPGQCGSSTGVTTRRHPARHPASSAMSSTSVRVLVASFAAGVAGRGTWESAPQPVTSACSSPHSIAPRPRAAARSPMRGASLPATEGGRVGTRTFIQSSGTVPLRRACASWPCRSPQGRRRRATATGRGSRRSIQFARLELITPRTTACGLAGRRNAHPVLSRSGAPRMDEHPFQLTHQKMYFKAS
jgi:hypothetical protein